MNQGTKSFFVFFRVCWYLSVFILFIFVLFDIHRIYDVITHNYRTENMIMEKESYYSSIKGGKTLTIYGNIDDNKVYFFMYDEEIDFNLFEENKPIKVVKFKHSKNVLRADNNAFTRWKTTRFRFLYYIFISIVFMIIKRKYKISIINILTKYYTS